MLSWDNFRSVISKLVPPMFNNKSDKAELYGVVPETGANAPTPDANIQNDYEKNSEYILQLYNKDRELLYNIYIKKNGSVSSIYSTKLGEDPNIINCSNTTPEKILEILETNEYINGG